MTTEASPRGYRLRPAGQVLLGLLSLGLIAGFAVAVALPPDPAGFGTHRGLGLPPCTIRASYNLPCPSCGLTTSFAHFVRGEFIGSVSANPAGFALAGLCALAIPWCWVSATQRRLWRVTNPDSFAVTLVAAFLILLTVQWTARLVL